MSKIEQKQLSLYANLMEEIKVRFGCINHAAAGQTGLPAPIAREFLYLQIRFLCELTALSCLVAHGDLADVKSHKIGRSYSADEILRKMTRLRPHFFPIAMRKTAVIPIGAGRKHHHVEAIEPPPLTKDGLTSLYAGSHRHLHRGSLRNLLSADTPLDMNLNAVEVVANAQKISDLLSHHLIAISAERFLLCVLANTDEGNRVTVATADRQDVPLAIQPQKNSAPRRL